MRVLEIAQLPSITALLKERRLRWLGHVHRMDSTRLPRQVLLSQVAFAKRRVGRPVLRFKDCVKRDMVAFNIDPDSWRDHASNRNAWRNIVSEGRTAHDNAWFQVLEKRRNEQNNRVAAQATEDSQYRCRGCLSRIGLFSHERCCQLLKDAT